MKKFAFTILLAVASTGAMAAATAITSGTAVDTTACTLLNESVTPAISKNVVAAYDCNTTTGLIGIATGSEAGKQKIYAATSAGGKVTDDSSKYGTCAASKCTSAEMVTAAGKASAT